MLFAFLKEQLAISRCIGRKEFDQAIRIYSRGLTNSDRDLPYLEMIALCHHWAGEDDLAIGTANQALRINSKSFVAASLLGQIHATQGDHELAVRYVRLGLQAYPRGLPAAPRWMVKLVWLLGRISPRFRSNEMETTLRDPDSINKEWHDWAVKYLDWYERTSGQGTKPTVH